MWQKPPQYCKVFSLQFKKKEIYREVQVELGDQSGFNQQPMEPCISLIFKEDLAEETRMMRGSSILAEQTASCIQA